jgi:hypothetical protein
MRCGFYPREFFADLWDRQGERGKARDLLAPVYGAVIRFARRGLLLLVAVEYRGDALAIGGEGRDAGALDPAIAG